MVEEEQSERIEKLTDEVEFQKESLEIWTDALVELSEIEDAFKIDGQPGIHGKTLLDVGTDAVKPLYIALKYRPSKIIGISECFSRKFMLELEPKAKLLIDTNLRLYTCSLFDTETFGRILEKEDIRGKFDFVLVSKALHHLRAEKCVEEHECPENEESCRYGFNTTVIFEKLLSLGERVIIYESFDATEDDADKVRGRGDYLGKNGFLKVLECLIKNKKYQVRLVRPQAFVVDSTTFDRVEPILRQVDVLCFYVQEQTAK